jgi:trimethylamine monooxygenase
MYLGMQDQWYTFTMFDAEAWFARDVILGRVELPSQDEMQKDMAAWTAREEALENAYQMIDFQADYVRELMKYSDYPEFDIDLTVQEFKEWKKDKEKSIVTYRDRAFKSPVTGAMAPVHHTPWWEAMDDSMATFLANGKEAA